METINTDEIKQQGIAFNNTYYLKNADNTSTLFLTNTMLVFGSKQYKYFIDFNLQCYFRVAVGNLPKDFVALIDTGNIWGLLPLGEHVSIIAIIDKFAKRYPNLIKN